MDVLENCFKDFGDLEQQIHCATISYPVRAKRQAEVPHLTREEKAFCRRIRGTMQNIYYIEKDIRQQIIEEDVSSEWKFVALIVDRIMLFVFSVIILIGTLKATLSAPSIFDQETPITTYFSNVIEYDDE
ncbi:Glutamyl aminopeptidase [Aphelenchoides bicaudatus]|nr:Glutamyl aminopeptidase [Aphelenchoides bicaudatus]